MAFFDGAPPAACRDLPAVLINLDPDLKHAALPVGRVGIGRDLERDERWIDEPAEIVSRVLIEEDDIISAVRERDEGDMDVVEHGVFDAFRDHPLGARDLIRGEGVAKAIFAFSMRAVEPANGAASLAGLCADLADDALSALAASVHIAREPAEGAILSGCGDAGGVLTARDDAGAGGAPAISLSAAFIRRRLETRAVFTAAAFIAA